MTFPWQFQIGVVNIPCHVIFESAGIFIGFRYFLYLRSKQHDPIHTNNRLWIIIGAIFGAVFGSRLIGGLENPVQLAAASNIFLHFYKNATIVGGLLGGLTGVEIAKVLINEKQSSGDLFVYPILLAMIIGRIGCFSMGVYEDTYGTVTDSIFGINLGDGQLRHPVALYEIAFLITAWMAIKAIDARNVLAEGGRFKLFMISYLSFRLCLELVKPHHPLIAGLSAIQLACTTGLLYYSYFIFHPRKIFASYA